MSHNHWKKLAILAIPACLAFQATISWADPPPMLMAYQKGPGPSADQHAQFIQQLNLSPEQAKRMQALRTGGHEQNQALHQQVRAKRQALMEYLQSPDATEGQALQMQSDINVLQGQLGAQRIRTWFQMREILTPEQLQKLKTLKKPHFVKPGQPERR